MTDDEDLPPVPTIGVVAQLTDKNPDGQFLPVTRPIGFVRFDSPKMGVRVVRKSRRKVAVTRNLRGTKL